MFTIGSFSDVSNSCVFSFLRHITTRIAQDLAISTVVVWSGCLLATTVSPSETAEPIGVSFGMESQEAQETMS